MRVFCLLLLAAVSVLRAVEPASPPPLAAAEGKTDVAGLFERLLFEGRSLDPLLRSVGNEESARSAALQLRRRLDEMAATLRQLELYAPLTEAQNRRLAQLLGELTQRIQGMQDVGERLREVNAYGSEELMALLDEYFEPASPQSDPLDNLPQARLYMDMSDSLEDALFELRRVRHAKDVSAALPAVEEALRRLTQKQRLLMALSPGMTAEQQLAMKQILEQWGEQLNDLQREADRLRAQHCYGDERLQRLLDACLQAMCVLPARAS